MTTAAAQRKAQKQAIEAKILALNKKQDSAEKSEELENLKILKRSLRKVFIRFFCSLLKLQVLQNS